MEPGERIPTSNRGGLRDQPGRGHCGIPQAHLGFQEGE